MMLLGSVSFHREYWALTWDEVELLVLSQSGCLLPLPPLPHHLMWIRCELWSVRTQYEEKVDADQNKYYPFVVTIWSFIKERIIMLMKFRESKTEQLKVRIYAYTCIYRKELVEWGKVLMQSKTFTDLSSTCCYTPISFKFIMRIAAAIKYAWRNNNIMIFSGFYRISTYQYQQSVDKSRRTLTSVRVAVLLTDHLKSHMLLRIHSIFFSFPTM